MITLHDVRETDLLGCLLTKTQSICPFHLFFVGRKDLINPVQYSTICKRELRSQDRRVAESVPNIFYKLKKLQIKRIHDSAGISIRKCKTEGKKYTAQDFKTEEGVKR